MTATQDDHTQAEAQDYPLEEVPHMARRSALSLAMVLTGFSFFTATMFAGAEVGVNFSFWPDVVLLVIGGNLLLGIYAAALAYAAQQTGLHSLHLARYAFGGWGAKLADLLLGLTQVGWYAWGTAEIANVLVSLTPLGEGWRIPLMIVFGLAFCLTAYVGYRGLDRLSRVAVPLMLVLIAVSFVIASGDTPEGGLLAHSGAGELGIAAALTAIVGTFASGATQSTNWSRFARTPKAAIGTTLLAFFVGNGLMVFSGAFTAVIYNEADIVTVLAVQGLSLIAVLMLFLNLWSTQDNTIYNFSVAGSTLFNSPNRRLITIAGAILGTGIALTGLVDQLVPYLVLLGTVIPPIGGVLLADFGRRRGRFTPYASTRFPAVNPAGIAGYAAGVAAAIWLPGIAPINGVLAAGLVYVLVDLVSGGTRTEAPVADRTPTPPPPGGSSPR